MWSSQPHHYYRTLQWKREHNRSTFDPHNLGSLWSRDGASGVSRDGVTSKFLYPFTQQVIKLFETVIITPSPWTVFGAPCRRDPAPPPSRADCNSPLIRRDLVKVMSHFQRGMFEEGNEAFGPWSDGT
ncbi:hypothetical protein AVEN_103023-1 [Araneus ventricosus]|uniref:Uncharacterized protein n=1 Tax=Araneus ventricosus TaxID=182803 RepID=A0A4Y2B8H2_ARAVE|nr:hypothetical protein AVEN_103023-1 [Araneus ventricosus]